MSDELRDLIDRLAYAVDIGISNTNVVMDYDTKPVAHQAYLEDLEYMHAVKKECELFYDKKQTS